jgi:membrane-bound ClpP family serine protease
MAMALRCNIDAKGKLIRLIYGVALVLIGAVLMLAWALRGGGGAFAWLVSIVAMLGGAFAIFESRKGWCAIRAMGLKTPF